MKKYYLCTCSNKDKDDQKQTDQSNCCPVCFCISVCDDKPHEKGCDGNGNKDTTPNRPGKSTGTDRGRIPGGAPLNQGDLSGNNPPGSWAGQRKFLQLPFLFLRANAGDTGSRPVIGPFWESPDILIAAGLDPALAPSKPDKLGQIALANLPNTVYAHVWNFGLSSAPNVIVEFRWCNPSLGINEASSHLIGFNRISLGSKGSGDSHKVVKCPKPWFPDFVNGGHECLLVRVWEETSDGLGAPEWDASLNRHIGQRNIHVIQSGIHPMMLMSGAHPITANIAKPVAPQIKLNVGPLYGAPAEVNVMRVAPHNMPWLQLHTGQRGRFPSQAIPTGNPSLTPPSPIGGKTIYTGTAAQHNVVGDNKQVTFTTSDDMPAPGEAHVYRVVANQNGQVFGGYTVVILG